MIAASVVAAAVIAGGTARAEGTITVGVYAPSTPFAGPVPRLEFASRLATQLGTAVGAKGAGKAYARAGDFSAAVKRGELAFAVVDAPYLAALGVPYRVLGAATRQGDADTGWELVTSGAGDFVSLAGKTLIVPEVGARSADFVARVLLESELPDDHFAKVTFAPDALSAITAVSLGRAQAALVPAGLPLPAGVKRGTALRSVPWPALVALPAASADQIEKAQAAMRSFSGGDVISGFTASDGGPYRALARRFGKPTRRGPLAVPPQRIAVTRLLTGRTFQIERPPVMTLLEGGAGKR